MHVETPASRGVSGWRGGRFENTGLEARHHQKNLSWACCLKVHYRSADGLGEQVSIEAA